MGKRKTNRKVRPTPKGEAAVCVAHAQDIVRGLRRISVPSRFAFRFNDFLRAGRAVLETLPKENGVRAAAADGSRIAKMVGVRREQLAGSDARFRHFLDAKDVSAHDFTINPVEARYGVSVGERLDFRSAVKVDLKDVEGRTTLVSCHSNPELTGHYRFKTRRYRSVRFFLSDWPDEDVVTYCHNLWKTLDSLVNELYRQFP